MGGGEKILAFFFLPVYSTSSQNNFRKLVDTYLIIYWVYGQLTRIRKCSLSCHSLIKLPGCTLEILPFFYLFALGLHQNHWVNNQWSNQYGHTVPADFGKMLGLAGYWDFRAPSKNQFPS